jgi:hypothetical protein
MAALYLAQTYGPVEIIRAAVQEEEGRKTSRLS